MKIPEWFKPGVVVKIVNDTCAHMIPIGTVATLTKRNGPYNYSCYTNFGNGSYVKPEDVMPIKVKTLEELL